MPTLSGKVLLVQPQTNSSDPALLFFQPVYASGEVPATVTERRAGIIGYIYLVFRAKDLLHDILDQSGMPIAFEIFDGEIADRRTLIYHGGASPGRDVDADPPRLESHVTMAMAGRTWTGIFHSTAALEDRFDLDLPLRVAVGGGLFSVLLAGQFRIHLDLPDDVWPMQADPSDVEDAMLNMAINARDAMPDGGRLTMAAENVSFDRDFTLRNPDVTPGDYVMLSFTDTGTGMPAAVIERAFEPFFTTKEPGKGTGLGLSMIYSFAKRSGGHLRIYSEVGHGLPRAATAQAIMAEHAQDVAEGAPGGTESILLVEDNEDVRNMVLRQLIDFGYRIAAAESGPAALAIIDAGHDFDLLFTDVVMPDGMSGYDLAAIACQRLPKLKVLITTGYARGAGNNDNASASSYSVLRKPYRRDELAVQVRAALDATV